MRQQHASIANKADLNVGYMSRPTSGADDTKIRYFPVARSRHKQGQMFQIVITFPVGGVRIYMYIE